MSRKSLHAQIQQPKQKTVTWNMRKANNKDTRKVFSLQTPYISHIPLQSPHFRLRECKHLLGHNNYRKNTLKVKSAEVH